MSVFSSFCGSPDICLPRSAAIVWQATRPARHVLHELHRAGGCHGPAPLRPGDPSLRPRPVCENVGCVDLFMDVWIHAHAAVHAKFTGPGETASGAACAYLTTSARSRMAELNRQARVDRGGVAKPQRRDGVVGRIARSFDDPWLADAFRFLLGYAASPGPAGNVWPLDALTGRKNMWDGGARVVGGAAARDELRRDVERCLAVAREVAGGGWLYECVILPLANRGRAPLPPEDLAGPPVDGPDAGLPVAAASMLDDMLARTRAGEGPAAALRAAVDGWLGDGPPPAAWASTSTDDLALRRLAKRLLAELREGEVAA